MTAALSVYRRTRERSAALFNLLTDAAYYSRPIELRHPIVFYDGHLPAFSFNTLIRKTLQQESIDPRLETLFARGIDPDERTPGSAASSWPNRQTVREFAAEADRRISAVLGGMALYGEEVAHAVRMLIEHEAMHQETLLYMWHRLPYEFKQRPTGYVGRSGDADVVPPRTEWCDVPAGRVTLGVNRGAIAFAWDNEQPAYSADVTAFAIDRYDVTNARYLEFVEAGGYSDRRWWTEDDWQWIQRAHLEHPLFWERHDGRWRWRGMFELIPLPLAWPVYVSHAEAAAFARWSGLRLPTEAEYQRAAYGSLHDERRYPWGNEPPDSTRGVFDFSSWDPEPVGSHPAGASAWGVEDLLGNGWEWTCTPFAPFPGFEAMPLYPEYSADFFDGQHMVMKGASPATAADLLRPTFRNWFRCRYPYVYATFRCVKDSI